MVDFPKRGWLEYTDSKLNVKLGGFLDECIQFDDNYYAVLDHKTRGSAPDSIHRAYRQQMDCYTFLLQANNFPTRRIAYLAYYIPQKITSGSDFQFEVLVKEIEALPERAQAFLRQAVEVLNGPLPPLQEQCPFCQWTATALLK